MQAQELSTKCSLCGLMLIGREQFLGHMIHSHDVALDAAIIKWKTLSAATHNIATHNIH
jgi:hypothetical protein